VQDGGMTEAAHFTIDDTSLRAALEELAEIGKTNPAKVTAFALSLGMNEDFIYVRARRSGLTLEPSAYLRGFLSAFGPAAKDAAPL
jgi:hypothetical protein